MKQFDFVLAVLGTPTIDLLAEGSTNTAQQVLGYNYAQRDTNRYQYGGIMGTVEPEGEVHFSLYFFDTSDEKPLVASYYRIQSDRLRAFEKQLEPNRWIVFHKMMTPTEFEWHLRHDMRPPITDTGIYRSKR
jgi:hypothetical protein